MSSFPQLRAALALVLGNLEDGYETYEGVLEYADTVPECVLEDGYETYEGVLDNVCEEGAIDDGIKEGVLEDELLDKLLANGCEESSGSNTSNYDLEKCYDI